MLSSQLSCPPTRVVLGSHNRKKAVELAPLFAAARIPLLNLADFPSAIEVDETGQTFQANATIKAVEQARTLGEWVLGEDSGLSVRALKGAPGVWSARYAGDPRDDERNNQKLLEDLAEHADRHAWYTCHMVLSDPQGNVWIDCVGHCCGVILREYRGQAGFGYDPLFLVPEYHRTFGELGLPVKSLISHRARAARKFFQRWDEVFLPAVSVNR